VSIDFSTPFVLPIRRAGTMHAFVGYFDTFFHPTGEAVPSLSLVSPNNKTPGFTTGPSGTPTHWKQTVFLLAHPFEVKEGDLVEGTFKCRKRVDNSRELRVEIAFQVKGKADQYEQLWEVQ
jgi:protein arginine N-methyltransferase 3